MKKINFLLALCCLAAALSLQFKEPDYVFSADEVKGFSKSFVPSEKTDIDKDCCIMDAGEVIPTGATYRTCKSGTRTCEPVNCATRSGEFPCPDAAK